MISNNMIREIYIRFDELIRNYVAPHKRTHKRLSWLTGLIDLQSVFDAYAAWRSYYRYKIMLNSQCAVLEGHLRKIFGPDIVVKSYDDGYVGIGLRIEPAHWKLFGRKEENSFVPFPLIGESGREFEGFNFLVLVYGDYDMNLIQAEVEKYKMADKKYRIKKV